MKKLSAFSALWLLALGTFANAQCTGVFPANTLCGNLTGTPQPPSAFSSSGTISGPVSSTNNGLPLWGNTLGTQLIDGNGGTIAGTYTWSGNNTYNGTGTFGSTNTFNGTLNATSTTNLSGSVLSTGPTAAIGSNGQATLGVTAASGAILKGQGSTNDVSLANKGGTIVCQIATGATTFNCTTLTLTNPLAVTSGGTGRTSLTNPTVQSFLTGSGTYTTPANVTWIKVLAIGGGGGGGGTGPTTGPTGTTGGNTTFGTTLIVANGGVGGTGSNTNAVNAGGAGGTASLGGTIGIATSGGNGGSGVGSNNAAALIIGGAGGVSCLGGNGGQITLITGAGTGSTAAANTGSGGSGAATNNGGTTIGGGGGGAGGCVQAIIPSPGATFSYAVGASGAGGVGTGANAATGGAGGIGVIIVEEHYNF